MTNIRVQCLERAKNDKLGAPMVGSEFLDAMLMVSEEVLRSRKELGSDGAVHRLLEQINDENELTQDDDLDSIFQ